MNDEPCVLHEMCMVPAYVVESLVLVIMQGYMTRWSALPNTERLAVAAQCIWAFFYNTCFKRFFSLQWLSMFLLTVNV